MTNAKLTTRNVNLNLKMILNSKPLSFSLTNAELVVLPLMTGEIALALVMGELNHLDDGNEV